MNRRVVLIAFCFWYVYAFPQIQMPAGSATSTITLTAGQCSGVTFTDQNPIGNYSANQNSTLFICPNAPGQYVTITFSAFNTESGFDALRILNGNNGTANALATFTGTTIPGTVTSSSTDGCLAFRFISDGSTNRAGWTATVSCTTTPGPAPSGTSAQDCGFSGGTTICNDASFSGNSSGLGNNDFAIGGNDGCLNGEHQSSWYYFSPVSSGTLSFNIIPSNGTDDYDFAIWGPTATLQCPAFSFLSPIRCSYAGVLGNTGLGNGAVDLSEGSGGDGYVAPLNVTAGQFYVMLIDNFSVTGSPFTLDWTFGGGASLNCSALPITLLQFDGQLSEGEVYLNWSTASEKNNDRFEIERSIDTKNWLKIGTVKGFGNSADVKKYIFKDADVPSGIVYYRLKQIDLIDNKTTELKTIVIENNKVIRDAIRISPNPVIGNQIQLQIKGQANKSIHIEILDYLGQSLFSNTVENTTDFYTYSISGLLPKGQYVCIVKTSNEQKQLRVILN
jgi:CUB domain/Secretion system C-terminal sorting domain